MTEEIKYLVRIANTDLDGNKRVFYALTRIKGVSYMIANAVCRTNNIDPTKKIGLLQEAEVAKIDSALKDISNAGLPEWLYNRRKDPETGKHKHLITTELQLTRETDIRNMKKIKSYKGVRHMLGQPVRGQRTRGHFRKMKGKIHLGVHVKAQARKGGRS